MQTAENRTVSLRAIDGRLASLSISAVYAEGSDAGPVIASIGQLLDEAGAGIGIRPVAAGGRDTGPEITLTAALPAGVDAPGTTITRLRSFYPIVRTQLPGLDLAVVASVGATVDDASIELACRHARRFGRRRIDVVPSPGTVVPVPGKLDRRLDDWRARFPELEFSVTPVASLLGQFATGKCDAEVIVAPAMFAEILEEVVGILSGAAGLATVYRFDEGRISVGAAKAANSLPAAALILGVADLLAWLGRVDVSGLIVDAWARTLEYGCHTADFRVMSPYARRLDGSEFTQVVASRLNESPRTLRLIQPGRGRASQQPPGQHLRLVT